MSMYESLYLLLHQYIYGLDTVLTPDMTLTLTLMSTIGCVFLVALPFLCVWRLVRMWF